MANETKPKHATLCAAFVAAQAEFTAVSKDAQNPYFKSEYATLLAVVAMVRPILARHGLAYTQTFTDDGMISTVLMHESGEKAEFLCPFCVSRQDSQGYGSAITYFRRYALQTALGVVVCDRTEDDAEAAMPPREEPQKPAQQKKPQQLKPVDFSTCPVKSSMYGKKWVDIPTDAIKKALALDAKKYPMMTAAHRNAALKALAERETQPASPTNKEKE